MQINHEDFNFGIYFCATVKFWAELLQDNAIIKTQCSYI